MGSIKQFNGTSWVDVPFKKFDGTKWVEPEVKKYDGTKWVVMNRQEYTKTWNTIWTRTYDQDGDRRSDSRGTKLYQGEYLDEPWGIFRSLIGFDNGSIRSDLAGAEIKDVKLFLRNEHWYYHGGGTAVLGYHNHSSEPTRYSHSKYDAKRQSYSDRGQAQWIDMPNDLGEGIRDGQLKGVSLFANSESMNYYGYFYGNSDGDNQPKLKITYVK